ncbi:small integral membrane protein 20 [Zerene cesonia]|uniref:small integral membrane protein 20 n=1 Tax=Zerene cesonia TaxID=33412 RepID=UPI0018E4E6E2|nr:small integral membrane protein 20 [Zerene cesonia]
MVFNKRWRFATLIGGLVGLIGLTLYPIAVSPMMDSSKYKEIQKVTRKNIKQEEIQPGNMKVWTDPFDRKKPQNE